MYSRVAQCLYGARQEKKNWYTGSETERERKTKNKTREEKNLCSCIRKRAM